VLIPAVDWSRPIGIAVRPERVRHRPSVPELEAAGRRGALGRLAFSAVSRYCLAHAQCPVISVPSPELARELRHGRLAWAFWHRSLSPEQILHDRAGRRPEETA